MKEARIECITTTPIPDLGLRMGPGDVEFIPEVRALASKHLWKIARQGAVKVRWVERYKAMRPKSPPAPFVTLSRKQKRSPKMTEQTDEVQQSAPPQAPQIDIEALVQRVREETRQEMQAQIDELKGALLAGVGEIVRDMPAPQTVVVERGAEGSGTGKAAGAEPTFIPDDLVKEDTKGRVKIEAAASEGDGVDDASAALAALRGKKKKKAAPKKGGGRKKS